MTHTLISPLDIPAPPSLTRWWRWVTPLTLGAAGLLSGAALISPDVLLRTELLLIITGAAAALLLWLRPATQNSGNLELYHAADMLDAAGVPTATLQDWQNALSLSEHDPDRARLLVSPVWLLILPALSLLMPSWLLAPALLLCGVLSAFGLPDLRRRFEQQFRLDVVAETLVRR